MKLRTLAAIAVTSLTFAASANAYTQSVRNDSSLPITIQLDPADITCSGQCGDTLQPGERFSLELKEGQSTVLTGSFVSESPLAYCNITAMKYLSVPTQDEIDMMDDFNSIFKEAYGDMWDDSGDVVFSSDDFNCHDGASYDLYDHFGM